VLGAALLAVQPVASAAAERSSLPSFVQPLPVASIGAKIADGAKATWVQFKKGGNTMWWILLCSIVWLAMAIERSLRLQRKRIIPVGLAAEARRLWKEGKHAEVAKACDAHDSVLSRAIKVMVEYRASPLQDISTIASSLAANEMRLHYRRVQVLTVVATISPLLGLFGTVAGMISAFEDFRLLGETGDPSVFAGAISLALITTAAGLIVAMPTLATYHFFKQRTNAYTDELEAVLQELTVEWFAKK
jgi:biopolymer transport protein ExbB